MKVTGYLVLAVAALAGLLFVQTLVSANHLLTAILLGGWLALPYVALTLALIFGARTRGSIAATVVVSVVVAGAGLLFLADTIYWHPDAQGAIAVVFTPIYQGIGIGALLPLCKWLFGKFDV